MINHFSRNLQQLQLKAVSQLDASAAASQQQDESVAMKAQQLAQNTISTSITPMVLQKYSSEKPVQVQVGQQQLTFFATHSFWFLIFG